MNDSKGLIRTEGKGKLRYMNTKWQQRSMVIPKENRWNNV